METITLINGNKQTMKRGWGNLYACTTAELRKAKASDFKSRDVIRCGKYYIHIEYGQYPTPNLCSWVEKNFKTLDCTPGSSRGFTPY